MAEEVPVLAKSGKKVYIKLSDLGTKELDAESQSTLRNVSGSTPYKPSSSIADGWLEAWKIMWGYRGKANPKCAHLGCGEQSGVGGHVCYNRPGAQVYIIPICDTCNNTAYDKELRLLAKECDGHRQFVRAIWQKGYHADKDGKIVDELHGLKGPNC